MRSRTAESGMDSATATKRLFSCDQLPAKKEPNRYHNGECADISFVIMMGDFWLKT
jgi:hypothetical protein